MDSLQTEEYDDSSYDPVVTLHHTGRENRAMASVFSYYTASFYSSSDCNDQLTQLPCAGHGFHSPHYLPDSSLTVELIRLPIATIVTPYPQCPSPLHGTAADDADVSTRKPRRFL